MKTIIFKLLIIAFGFTLNPQIIKDKFIELGVKNPRVEYYFMSRNPFVFLIETYQSHLKTLANNSNIAVYNVVTGAWINNDGSLVLGGLAPLGSIGRKKDRVSISAWNGTPERIQHSIIALLHELAHQLGARHDDSNCNIMHPDAMNCFDKEFCQIPEAPELCDARNLQWNKKAQMEVKRTLNVALINRNKNKN